MQTIEKIKYVIHRHFRLNYGVHLTQAQLDDIHDFYHETRKEVIKDLGYYRVINAVLVMIVTGVWVLIAEKPLDSWFFLIVANLFVFYNIIHAGINYIQYKRIKTPNRPSDE